MSTHKSLWSMTPLFLVLFIDGMGLGLLFPILNTVLIDPYVGFLPEHLSVNLRDFYYGLCIGIFMLAWFFGAAVLGDLSDNIGRKKCLMVCLWGAFLGYFLSAVAIIVHSFTLLILGRVIAGLTAGSQPIAQAAIIDISPLDKRAQNIGFILLSVSLGFVFGPVFGGVLSSPQIVSWFTYTTPLYFASALSLFNAVLLALTFQETTGVQKKKIDIRWNHAIQIFISAFRHRSITRYSIALMVMIFGWSNYFSFVSLYLLQTYQYTIMENSFFLAVMGAGFSIGCGFIVNHCTKRYNYDGIVIYGLFLSAVLILLSLVFQQEWVPWVTTFLVGLSISVAYSVLLTIFSNLVTPQEQGWVMGVTGSIMALCFGLTSMFTGLIAHLGAALPMILAIVGLAGSAFIMLWIHKTQAKPVASSASGQ